MDERALQENSESILVLSFAGAIPRWCLKRRQRYLWAGLLSFEKPKEQDPDSIPRGEGNTVAALIASSCLVMPNGDGIALAYRAGTPLKDIEFVQADLAKRGNPVDQVCHVGKNGILGEVRDQSAAALNQCLVARFKT
jgi:hypothetical protein